MQIDSLTMLSPVAGNTSSSNNSTQLLSYTLIYTNTTLQQGSPPVARRLSGQAGYADSFQEQKGRNWLTGRVNIRDCWAARNTTLRLQRLQSNTTQLSPRLKLDAKMCLQLKSPAFQGVLIASVGNLMQFPKAKVDLWPSTRSRYA